MKHDKVWRTLHALSDGFWAAGGLALIGTVVAGLLDEEASTLQVISTVFVFVGIALGVTAWLYRRGVARDQVANRVAGYRSEVLGSFDKASDQ